MKTTMICFAIAVALRVAFDLTAQTPTPPAESVMTSRDARAIPVEGKIAGDWRAWLWISRVNLRDTESRGFDPSYTVLLSDYKPIVRKLDNGKWSVTFTSEIAQGIP